MKRGRATGATRPSAFRPKRSASARRHVAVLPLFALLSFFALLSGSALAQAPDIRPRVDLAVSFDYRERDGSRTARLYSPLGRPSTVGLTLILETGYNVVVSERLQRLPKDGDADLFDEAYLEDPGIFRVGKQYLPFGTGRLLRESVTAARIDSNLIAENLPVTFAFCSAGEGRQKGGLLRVGRSIGASLFLGEHFGIAGTSLGVIRSPDDAPGRGGGWGQAYGFDASRRLGKLALSADFVSLNGGPQAAFSVLDLEATYFSDAYRTIGVGLTSASGDDPFVVRLFGRVHAARNVDLEPLVRWRSGGLYDAAVTLRLRL